MKKECYNMVEVSKIDSLEELRGLKPFWDKLLIQNETQNIFLAFDWLNAWWSTFGKDYNLYVLVAKDQDEVVGLAPFMQTKTRSGQTIKFIGTPEADYVDFIIHGDKSNIIQAFISYLINNQSDWNSLDFIQIPDRSSTLPILRGILSERKIMHQISVIDETSSYVYEGESSRQSTFSLPAKNTRRLKQYANYFKNNGGLEFKQITDATLIKKLLPKLFQFHYSRWKDTPTPSRFINSQHRDFFYKLANILSVNKQLCLSVLYYSEEPIAFCMNFAFGQKLYLYTSCYDVYYTSKSPGSLLILLQTEHCIRNGYNELDYIRGGEAYKSKFTNRSYKNYRILVFAKRSEYIARSIYTNLKNTAIVRKITRSKKYIDVKNILLTKLEGNNNISGYMNIIKIILNRITRIFIDYRSIYVFTYDNTVNYSKKPLIDVELLKLGKDDIPKIISFYSEKYDSKKYKLIAQRFEQGADCHAALYNGEIVSIVWGVYQEDVDEYDTQFSLKPEKDQVVLCDVLTSPIYRGMGISPYIKGHLLKEYNSKGLTPIGAVEKGNKSNLKASSKLNIKILRKVKKLKILNIRIK